MQTEHIETTELETTPHAEASAGDAPIETHAETQEVKHEATLFAEPIAQIGPLTVTNALFTSWIAVAVLVVLSVFVRRKLRLVPKGLQSYVEVVLDEALKLADTVTGSRERTLKFMPIVLPLFLFILVNNWLGILPGVGSIGFIQEHHGELLFIPLFRGASADLNFTLALAIMAVICTHIFGVVLVSGWSHLNRFIGLDLLIEIPRKVFKEKEFTAILVNPVKFFVGLIEIVGELSKVASLSFRLFGNVFAGEVLLGAMTALVAYAVPIPFLFLEIIVGIIQALIFSLLTLVFLTVMATSHEEHDEHPAESAEAIAEPSSH